MKIPHSFYRYKKMGMGNLIGNAFNRLIPRRITCPMPNTIVMEISRMCNLRCRMCWRRAVNTGNKYLTFDNFKRIIKEMDFISRISFVGLGEPLMNPDFFKIVGFCDKNNIMLDITTNGTLLTEEIAKKMAGSKSIKTVIFSFDGFEQKTYEKIRVGADYNKVKKNIESFLQMKKGISTCIEIVGMKANVNELNNIAKFAKEGGASAIGIGQIHSTQKYMLSQLLYPDEHIMRLFKDIEEYCWKNKIRSIISIGQKTRICSYPWGPPYIQIDGGVKPCCFLGNICSTKLNEWFRDKKITIDIGSYMMGNIFKDSFRSIWNSEKYKSLRNFLKAQKTEKIDFAKYAQERSSTPIWNFPNYCGICQYRYRMGRLV